MAVKKGTSASSPDRGYVAITSEIGRRSDFVTWQSKNGFRFWIHSRWIQDGEANQYYFISFEMEMLNSESGNAPTKQEIDTRAKLAAARKNPTDLQKLTAASFRGLPVGRLLSTHSLIIAELNFEDERKARKPLNLVKEYESNLLSNSEDLEISRTFSYQDVENLGATRRDSILVAYLYSKFIESGSSKPASNIAKYLEIEVKRVYTAIRVARRNGWLTSNGPGISEGMLTHEGLMTLHELKNDDLIKKFIGNKELEMKLGKNG